MNFPINNIGYIIMEIKVYILIYFNLVRVNNKTLKYFNVPAIVDNVYEAFR